MRRLCSLCTVAGLLEAGETATLRKLMRPTGRSGTSDKSDGSYGQRALEWSYSSIGDCILCCLRPKCYFAAASTGL